jgi:hypothetical protein
MQINIFKIDMISFTSKYNSVHFNYFLDIYIIFQQYTSTVTVSVSVQQYPSTPSLHVSALLGHLQVMIIVL